MAARRARVGRAAAATGIGVLLAAVSHTYGGGDAPAPAIVLAAALLAWPVAVLLSAARLGLAGVAAGAVLSQATLHAAFALAEGAESTAGRVGADPLADGHHHALLAGGTSTATGAATAAGMGALPDAGMLTAHAVAALVAFLVLGFGRRAVRAILAGVRTAARRTSTLTRPAARILLPTESRRIRVIRALWSRTLQRRGPPALSVAT
jgi:hypothetical protein